MFLNVPCFIYHNYIDSGVVSVLCVHTKGKEKDGLCVIYFPKIHGFSNPNFRMNVTFFHLYGKWNNYHNCLKMWTFIYFTFSLHLLVTTMQTRFHFKTHNGKAKLPTNSVWCLSTSGENLIKLQRHLKNISYTSNNLCLIL